MNVLAWLFCSVVAAGQERHYVWSGVTIQDGKPIGRAVSALDKEQVSKARADRHAAEFRKGLAGVRLAIDVDGDLEKASRILEDIHVRGSWALDFDGQWGILVDVAKQRAELFTALGRKDDALRAASVLLLDEAEAKAATAAGLETVPADEAMLAKEKEALGDPALVEIRKRLSTRPTPSQLPAPSDEIEKAVFQAVSERRPSIISQIGPRAAPALEKIILSTPDELPDQSEQDLLKILFDIAGVHGGKFVLAHLDAGGFFWRKRILRAMAQAGVLKVSGPIDPAWLSILENLLPDPEFADDTYDLIGAVLSRDALTPGLQQALLRVLDSSEPGRVTSLFGFLPQGCGQKTVKPLFAGLLRHPNETVRRKAAERMFCWDSSDEFLACVDHEDTVMRRQLARFLQTHSTPGGNSMIAPRIGTSERTVLARLAADPDASVRMEAVNAIRGLDSPLAPEVYEGLASDRDADVLGQLDRLLYALVAQPEQRPPWIFSVLAKRRANRAARLGHQLNDSEQTNFYRALLNTDAGATLVFRWALDEPDDKLLETAVRHMKWLPDRHVDIPAPEGKAAPADPAVFALDDAMLEKVYRRAFDVSRDAFWRPLNEGLTHTWWGSKARVDAVLPVLKDASAARELRLGAATIAATRGGDAIDGTIERLIADPSWSTEPPNIAERHALGKILDRLPRPDRARVALHAIRTKSVPDLVAASFLTGFGDRGAFPAEAARPALDRWLDATSERLTEPWVGVLWAAVWKLPAQPPDETVARYLVRALDMGGEIQTMTLQKISELRWPVFLEVLGKRVRACDFSVVSPLAAYMDDRAAGLLLEAMGSCPNEEFRKACLAALDGIRKYQDEKSHWAARKNGQQARDEAVAKLVPMLADPDEKIRAQAVLSLATLDAVEQLPRLVEMLKDKSPAVREAAAKALERLNQGEGKKP